MSTRKAIFFDDVAAFNQFVEAHGQKAVSKQGYELMQIKPADGEGDAGLLLMGFHPRKRLGVFGGFAVPVKHYEITIVSDTELIAEGGGRVFRATPVHHVKSQTLIELIRPHPWRRPIERARELVLIWVNDAALVPQLVAASLSLGNDQIRFAFINGKAAKRNGGNTKPALLRIEQPSYFLLQLCLERFADAARVFYFDRDQLWLQWGCEHPLRDMWLKAARESNDLWLFSDDGRVDQLAPLDWQDIYEATEITLAGDVNDAWLQATGDELRIPLALRLDHRTRRADPELWLLDEADRDQLERLLASVDEADLEHLVLCNLTDDAGRQFTLIREKHIKRQRRFFDFAGRRFAGYRGFGNLMLPIDCELLPQLRRDRYAELFNLRDGELTLVVPTNDAHSADAQSEPKITLLRADERAFNPVSQYIDYLIEAQADTLTAVMDRSVFDFKHYAAAPSRPDLLKRPGAERDRKRTQTETQTKKSGDDEATVGDDDDARRAAERLAKQREAALDDEPRSTLQQRERDLEEQLVTADPALETWSALAEVKAKLDNAAGAARCAVEAAWLAPPGSEVDRETTHALQAYVLAWRKLIPKAKSAEAIIESPDAPRVLALALDAPPNEDALHAWVRDTAAALRAAQAILRVKERWLAWRQVLAVNRDTVELARQRDQIVEQLRRGLSHDEIPDFIRTAIMRQQRVATAAADSGEGDQAAEFSVIIVNLKLVHDAVSSLTLRQVRDPAMAMLTRVYARLGAHKDARACLKLAERSTQRDVAREDPVTACIVCEYLRRATPVVNDDMAARFEALAEQLHDGMDKDQQATVALFAESLQLREQVENPTQFLSAENYRHYFAVSRTRVDRDEALASLMTKIEQGEAPAQAGAMFDIADAWLEESRSTQQLALRVRQLVETLGKLRWHLDAADVSARYEQFVKNARAHIANTGASFYTSLLGVALAQGYVDLGLENPAGEMLIDAMKSEPAHVYLDLIDTMSAALNTIEGMPLPRRTVLLKAMLQRFPPRPGYEGRAKRLDESDRSYHKHVLRLLDQLTEAASSKDKLSLAMYRKYLDHDEFVIRRRVLQEDPCAAGQSHKGNL